MDTIRLITWNILNDNPNFERNSIKVWENRKEGLISTLRQYSPDIFGIQEAKFNQLDDISKSLPNYTWFGQCSSKNYYGEYVAIFVQNDKFHIKKHSSFWLSENSKTESISWNAKYPRICSYVLLSEKKTDFNFAVFNTHLSHSSKLARINSLNQIKNKIEELKCKTAIIMGDFNITPHSKIYREFMSKNEFADTLSSKHTSSYCGMNNSIVVDYIKQQLYKIIGYRLDYILYTGFQMPVCSHIIKGKHRIKYSDHYPVLADFIIGQLQDKN